MRERLEEEKPPFEIEISDDDIYQAIKESRQPVGTKLTAYSRRRPF